MPMAHCFNTNADTIASVISVSLSKHFDVRLIYCFEKKGVLMDVKDANSVINLLDKPLYNKYARESLSRWHLAKTEERLRPPTHRIWCKSIDWWCQNLSKNLGLETEGTLVKINHASSLSQSCRLVARAYLNTFVQQGGTRLPSS